MLSFQELHRWHERQFESDKYNTCYFCKQTLMCWFDKDGNPALRCVHCDMTKQLGLNFEDHVRKQLQD